MFTSKCWVMIGISLVNLDNVVSITPGSRNNPHAEDDTEEYITVALIGGDYIEVSSLAFPAHCKALMEFVKEAPSFIEIMDRKRREAALHAGPEKKGGQS